MTKKHTHKKKKHQDEEVIEESHHFVRKTVPEVKEEEEQDVVEDFEDDTVDEIPSASHVSEQLSEIYKNQDGSLPNMTFFEQKRRGRVRRAFFTFIFSCLLLVGVGFGGFYFFGADGDFAGKEVTVTVTGEEQVAAGELVQYRIRYRNNESVPLSKSSLSIRYPDGFRFEESSIPPSNDAHDTWDLGVLQPGEGGYIDVFGSLYGSVGTEKSFRVFLNYTPSNFSSEFQAAGVGKIKITDSPIALTLSAPELLTKGEVAPLVFTLTPRNASATLEHLAVVVDGPEGLTKQSATPDTENFGDLLWHIDTLEKETSIALDAAFSLQEGVLEFPLSVRVIGWPSAARQGEGFVLVEKNMLLSFQESEFGASLKVNGSDDAFSLTPQEEFLVQVALKNNGGEALKNVRAVVTVEAPVLGQKSVLDWAKIEDQNQNSIVGEQVNAELRNGILSWDASQVAALSSIAPKSEVPLSFRLPFKSSESIDWAAVKAHTIRTTLEVQYEVGGKKQVSVIGPVVTTINSNVSVDVQKEVKTLQNGDDEFLVTWNIENTFHPLERVELSADIFGDIVWNADAVKTSVGAVNFDSNTKKITWKVDALPAQKTGATVQFGFVRKNFNPSQTILVSKVQVSAHDTVTGMDMLLLEPEIPNQKEEKE